MRPIYLDYAATTPVDPAVIQPMQNCLSMDGAFGNPSSSHFYGSKALQLIENARLQVADLLHALPEEIIWTSGATEANNLAVKGIARLYRRRGQHIVTLKTEHKAVLDPCLQLEKEGFSVTYLIPKKNGLVDLDQLENALRPDTILVSMMHVNNETGVIQLIPEIAKLSSARGIFLHVDAVQSIGKLQLDLRSLPIDLLSLTAHKIYGPKGVGALFLRKKPRVRVEPLIHGGGHEQGMRSGTLATHQIVGLGAACSLAKQVMATENERIRLLRSQLWEHLQAIPNCKLNAETENCIPHILNVRFEGMIADSILASLPQLAVSTASACQAKGVEGSHVLRAMGYTSEVIKSSIRFSLGRFTTTDEINKAGMLIKKLFANQINSND